MLHLLGLYRQSSDQAIEYLAPSDASRHTTASITFHLLLMAAEKTFPQICLLLPGKLAVTIGAKASCQLLEKASSGVWQTLTLLKERQSARAVCSINLEKVHFCQLSVSLVRSQALQVKLFLLKPFLVHCLPRPPVFSLACSLSPSVLLIQEE